MRDSLHAPADAPPESRRRIKTASAWVLRRLGSWCCWMSVALVVYVLSIGPVVKFMLKGPIPEEVVETVYAPIIWLGKTESVGKLMDGFFNWYGEKIWGWSIF